MMRVRLIWFVAVVLGAYGGPLFGQLPPANPISAVIPSTPFSLQLEDVIRIPDSSTGNGRFARIEQITPAIDGSATMYVADQRGKVYSFEPGDSNPTLFFDFGANIPNFKNNNSQSGLRGFAFHPDAFTQGAPGFQKFYTAHEIDTPNPSESHLSVVSEWTLNGSGTSIIAGSRRDVLTQSQPRNDHNIGKLGFDPNLGPADPDYGNLYISFGDGGNYRSPQAGGNDTTLSPEGQDTTNFLGSMLRINPLASGPDPYSVPSDNPFTGQSGFQPEIWAYGLRNPHHFGWDRGGNGDMLIADIGQSNIEEVNLGVSGANYGWAFREGTFDVTGKAPDNPIAVDPLPGDHPTDPYTYPVAQYDHDFDNTGQISAAIAGGYVYRGSQVTELAGKYLFGNFGSDFEGPIYAVDVDQLQLRDDFTNLTAFDNGFLAPVEKISLVDSGGQPTTLLTLIRQKSGNNGLNRTDMRFGLDNSGEVYVSSKNDGWIRRFSGTPLPDCDFDNNGNCGPLDVDSLTAEIVAAANGGSPDLAFDMTGDGNVDGDDLDEWLAQAGAASPALTGGNPFLPADANLDGEVDGQDFIRWNDSKFTINDEFTSGDFNADGNIDGQDFVVWNNFKFTSSDAINGVPEPASGIGLVMVALGWLLVSRS